MEIVAIVFCVAVVISAGSFITANVGRGDWTEGMIAPAMVAAPFTAATGAALLVYGLLHAFGIV